MLKSCLFAVLAAAGLALSTPAPADARVGVFVGPRGGVAVRAGRPYYGGGYYSSYGYGYPSYGYTNYGYSYPSYGYSYSYPTYSYPTYGYGYGYGYAPYYGGGRRGVVVGPNGGGIVYGPRGAVRWR